MKKNILLPSLFAVTIILVVINLVMEDYTPVPEVVIQPKEISRALLEQKLKVNAEEFGIKEEWISEVNLWGKGGDSLPNRIEIKLPAEIEQANFIKDFFAKLPEDSLRYLVTEPVIGLESRIRIRVKNFMKLDAIITTDSTLVRNYPFISFVLTNFDDLSEEELTEILKFPYDFAFLLSPGTENLNLYNKLKEYRKDSYLILNDDMDKRYNLNMGAGGKKIIENHISNIIKDFNPSNGLLVAPKSEMYRSVVFNFIRDEFKAKNLFLASADKIVALSAETQNELISKIFFYAKSAEENSKHIFYIDATHFSRIKKDLRQLKKYGYRLKTFPLNQYQY